MKIEPGTLVVIVDENLLGMVQSVIIGTPEKFGVKTINSRNIEVCHDDLIPLLSDCNLSEYPLDALKRGQESIIINLALAIGELKKENGTIKNRIQQLEAVVKNHHQDETLHPEIVLFTKAHDDIPA